METQTILSTPEPRTVRHQRSDNGLEKRMAQLEAEVISLRKLLQELLPVRQPSVRQRGGYAWVSPPLHLQGVGDLSQLEAEQLVYIHELTDEDVVLRLQELEQRYNMTSAEFYRLWQHGEADDILEKIEWSLLYEDWLRISSGTRAPVEELT